MKRDPIFLFYVGLGMILAVTLLAGFLVGVIR